jgi:transcriptional antiterminator RfaH
MEEVLVCDLTAAPASCAAQNAWFCLRTHLARESIAAAQLRQEPEIEVFLPRIRYERSLRLRRMWVTEALFPNYIFARFDLAAQGRRVRSARAVKDMVHFGNRYPTIPETVIEELRSLIGPEELRVVKKSFVLGQPVRIAGGPFHDLEAVVVRDMPRQRRVAVLLDFLGRQTNVELDDSQLMPAVERPRLAGLVCG